MYSLKIPFTTVTLTNKMYMHVIKDKEKMLQLKMKK